MRVVGLTGGIATGKSTVARMLRDRGLPVLDADLAAREVVEPGQPTLQALVDALGAEILTPAGTLDRPALRARIAVDPDVRATLDGIIHPAIRANLAERILALTGEGHPVVIVEAALLVETGSYRQYASLVVVTCDPAVQLERLIARDGGSEETARGMLDAQLPLADKEAVADIVIRNDAGLEELERAVDAVLGEILGQAPDP